MEKFVGGYLMTPHPIIRAGIHRHSAALETPVSPLMVRALNLIQGSAYAIDPFIATTMAEAYESNDAIGDIPLADPIPVPDRLPDDIWEGMSDEARLEHKVQIAGIHGENARLVNKRKAFRRKLKVAFELMRTPVIWFPCNFDFRSRIYPLPQDLNPQGDDIAKALLRFSRGRPLGKVGAYWLAVAIANAFGHDKVTMDERMSWVMDHANDLIDSVENPLGGKRFWTEADEPWGALALAREFVGWLSEGDDYISYRPVNVDATCSGMQHLSAMARDPIGATLTNLTSRPDRQDLYGEVAKRVIRKVERMSNESEQARAWLGHVDRKTVKRAVMTTPYGVTDRGVRDQLIEDGFTRDLEGAPLANAEFMKECIKEALSDTARSAKDVMAYIQGVAKALAEEGIPLDWTTPTGFKVRQAYWHQNEKRVYTVFGRATLRIENPDQGLNVRKQALASAPNFVHSYDASHLSMTAVEANERHGIMDFAMIHDSFGTHAAEIPNLNRVLRETFVEIYKLDRLAMFEEEVRSYAPDVELPARPAYGDFDVTQVLEAPFFFS